MLDADLARFYAVATRDLNKAVSRNLDRFPEDFAFRLTADEADRLRSQFATSKGRGGRRYLPWVFTEHGALMAASVLNSPIAIAVSIEVVRAFVRMRQWMLSREELAKRLASLDRKFSKHDAHIAAIFQALRNLMEPPGPAVEKGRIGFEPPGSGA